MGIFLRGKKWYVDVRDTKGRRIRRSVGRHKEIAELVQKDLEVKIAKELYLGIFAGATIPFSQYAKEWLARKILAVKKSTYGDYRSIMEVHAIPYFGEKPIGNVSRRDVESFLNRLHNINISGKRKNNIFGCVKVLFGEACLREDIAGNPTEHVRHFREEKPLIDPFSLAEMKSFFQTVDPHFLPYFGTAFLTGMRHNELIALKWPNVDFEMRCIGVREGRVQGVDGPPKNFSSYRDIDMLDPLYEILMRHRKANPDQCGFVFLGPNGAPLDVNNLRNRIWYPTLAAAGLRRRCMYKTRHTFGSLMLANGEDPVWVSKMLGHHKLDMIFGRYGKFVRNRSRRDGSRFLQSFAEARVVAEIPDPNQFQLPIKLAHWRTTRGR